MKNDLTADEWLVLSDYLQFGSGVFYDWEQDDEFYKKSKLLKSAEQKVKSVADDIRKDVV